MIFFKNDDIHVIFIVFLSIMSSFIFKILACPMQKFLARNVLARNVIYLSVVLFTTTFLSDAKINPVYHFMKAFIIYLFIVITTKMSIHISIILFLLMMSIYVMQMYIKYFDHKKTESHDNNKLIYNNYNQTLQKITNILFVLVLIITLYGAVNFTIVKKRQYGKKFSLFKFLFGVRKCEYD